MSHTQGQLVDLVLIVEEVEIQDIKGLIACGPYPVVALSVSSLILINFIYMKAVIYLLI